jgi:competence protein ComGC
MEKTKSNERSRGFTLGELLVVFAVTAGLVLVFMPLIRNINNRQLTVECQSNLKTIGLALYMYANSNDGRFPPSVKTLYEEKYLSDKAIMDCPFRKKTGTIDDPDYVYVAGLSLKSSKNQPMVFDKDSNHSGSGRNVLFLNGDVLWQE